MRPPIEHPGSPSPQTCPAAARRQALRSVGPRLQTVLYAVGGILASFVLPAVLLCGVLRQSGIVWAITATMLATGLVYLAAGRRIERAEPDSRRVDDLLLGGILLVAASLLMALLAVQPGPMRLRTLPFGPSLAVAGLAVAAGVAIMWARARRLWQRLAGTPSAGK